MFLRKPDYLNGSLRRNCLPALIVADVPLCAANPIGHSLLGHTQPGAKFFQWTHDAGIVAALLFSVNSAASGDKK